MPTAFFLLLLLLAGCITAPKSDKLVLEPTSFIQLSGWEQDHHSEALAAFLKSCDFIMRKADHAFLHKSKLGGTAFAWKKTCRKARQLPPHHDVIARHFFEQSFVPFTVKNHQQEQGLFTGYYEIDLKGSRQKDSRYRYPLYSKPADLPKNQPYYSRKQIEKGALKNKGLELVFVDDPVRAFFLHIQGSGRIHLDNGDVMLVNYAGKNGHPYTAIGKYLIEKEGLDRKTLSAERIMQWLYAHPEKAEQVMDLNASYVFFREYTAENPIGAEGSTVTPKRTLAIDRRFIPYGSPLWLDTTLPAIPTAEEKHFQRLMIAQDTGGALRGPVRGDVFFGHGRQAEALASAMKQPGTYTILLPVEAASYVSF